MYKVGGRTFTSDLILLHSFEYTFPHFSCLGKKGAHIFINHSVGSNWKMIYKINTMCDIKIMFCKTKKKNLQNWMQKRKKKLWFFFVRKVDTNIRWFFFFCVRTLFDRISIGNIILKMSVKSFASSRVFFPKKKKIKEKMKN